MTAPARPEGWKSPAWDVNPPQPGDADHAAYRRLVPLMIAYNQALIDASDAAGPPQPTPYSNGRETIDPESAPPLEDDDPGPDPAQSPVQFLPSPREPMKVAARLVADRYTHPSGAALVQHWRGFFWQWLGPHWAELDDDALKAAAYRFAAPAFWMKDDKPEPWAPNRYKVGDLIDALKASVHIPMSVTMPSWHAMAREERRAIRADTIVACSNGLLHVPTRTLIDHDPSYFNAVSVPFPYQAKAPRPDGWLRFLGQLWPDDPEAIDALGEFFGYVVSGRLDLHKIMLIIGPTRAGKGVIARILKSLVGQGNSTGPTLSSLGTNFGLQPLIGKPLAIISDARLGDSETNVVVERLLSISGEDMLPIDRKYKAPWTGTLPTRFMVISNELPRFGDASGAIANRFIVLTLKRSWLGHEDPALTAKLLPELPGILSWALDGLDRLEAHGYMSEPRSSQEAKLVLADLVSPVSAFIRDRCETGPGEEVAIDALFGAWKH